MTNAVKKYKTVPKCKKMISNSMFHYITQLSSCTSGDSLVCGIVDWIALGCYNWFQKLEWCSDHHDSFATIDDPTWGNHPTALPVIASDFRLSTESLPDEHIMFTTLCFHKQKNNDSGQTLTYHSQTDSSWMCPTQGYLNIV